jgi:hypothetical protein
MSTRVGVTLAAARETQSAILGLDVSDNFTGRGGVLVGWGAPFTDDWLGFTVEGGAVGGDRTMLPLSPQPNTSACDTWSGQLTPGQGCERFRLARNWLSPYGAAMLVVQIPERLRVGSRLIPLHPVLMGGARFQGNGWGAMFVDLGFAWNGP